MQRTGVLTFGERLPALALARLGAAGRGAWLIEVETGRIVAANREGARLLHLKTGEQHPSLDAASPALVTLRAFAQSAHDKDGQEKVASLLFWLRDRALRLACKVGFTEGDSQLAVVVQQPEPRDASDRSAPLHDDSAKLKEIARRIREGHSVRQPPRRAGPEAAASGAAPPSSLKARLAHELRTPASAIAAAAEIMKEERLGPIGTARYQDYASDIHASAQHMLAVIERMLADARADDRGASAGAMPGTGGLSFAELDVENVLRSSVSQLAPLAEQARIALALDLPPRLPHLVADATSLRQIVLNLLTNALKFTGPGGRVTVSARYSLDGPLTVAVSDTGHGMAPPKADEGPAVESAEANRGLGLGLPLVRALAAANGAELILDSVPGQGTSAAIVFARDRVVPV